VMISLRVPWGLSSDGSWQSCVKRSSTVISGLLQEVDSAFGTVGRRQACLAFVARRYGAVTEDLPVTLVVRAEQVGREVIAAAVSLAAFGADLHFH
jgi:hypothetical protein